MDSTAARFRKHPTTRPDCQRQRHGQIEHRTVRQREVKEVGIGDACLAIETDESQYPLMVIEAVHGGTFTLPERNLKES